MYVGELVATARVLMAPPKLMSLDVSSMGLVPLLVEEMYEIVVRLNKEERVGILLGEQNAAMAPQFAKYGYVMENERKVMVWRG